MYEETVAKRFNIENTYMVLFFWLSHSVELDLMNKPARKKFIGSVHF